MAEPYAESVPKLTDLWKDPNASNPWADLKKAFNSLLMEDGKLSGPAKAALIAGGVGLPGAIYGATKMPEKVVSADGNFHIPGWAAGAVTLAIPVLVGAGVGLLAKGASDARKKQLETYPFTPEEEAIARKAGATDEQIKEMSKLSGMERVKYLHSQGFDVAEAKSPEELTQYLNGLEAGAPPDLLTRGMNVIPGNKGPDTGKLTKTQREILDKGNISPEVQARLDAAKTYEERRKIIAEEEAKPGVKSVIPQVPTSLDPRGQPAKAEAAPVTVDETATQNGPDSEYEKAPPPLAKAPPADPYYQKDPESKLSPADVEQKAMADAQEGLPAPVDPYYQKDPESNMSPADIEQKAMEYAQRGLQAPEQKPAATTAPMVQKKRGSLATYFQDLKDTNAAEKEALARNKKEADEAYSVFMKSSDPVVRSQADKTVKDLAAEKTEIKRNARQQRAAAAETLDDNLNWFAKAAAGTAENLARGTVSAVGGTVKGAGAALSDLSDTWAQEQAAAKLEPGHEESMKMAATSKQAADRMESARAQQQAQADRNPNAMASEWTETAARNAGATAAEQLAAGKSGGGAAIARMQAAQTARQGVEAENQQKAVERTDTQRNLAQQSALQAEAAQNRSSQVLQEQAQRQQKFGENEKRNLAWDALSKKRLNKDTETKPTTTGTEQDLVKDAGAEQELLDAQTPNPVPPATPAAAQVGNQNAAGGQQAQGAQGATGDISARVQKAEAAMKTDPSIDADNQGITLIGAFKSNPQGDLSALTKWLDSHNF
jgi:hypothetical protein